MKKTKFFLVLAAALLAGYGYAAEMVWDFSKNSYPLEMMKNGKSSSVQNGLLMVGGGSNTSPEGIRSKEIAKELSPEGDLSITIRFKLDNAQLDKMPQKTLLMLADCKGELWPPVSRKDAVAHSGFGVGIYRKSNRTWDPNFFFGYGDHSYSVIAPSIEIPDENLHTLTCCYFMRGEVQILFDGRLILTKSVPAGKIASPKYPFFIGERASASFWCLEGAIAEVRVDMPKPAPVTMVTGARNVFERTETMNYHVKILNQTGEKATVQVKLAIAGQNLNPVTLEIPKYSTEKAAFVLPDRLRPGKYIVTASAKSTNMADEAKMSTEIVVVAEENPEAMPVFMWQGGDPKLLAEMGFTAQIATLSDAYVTGNGNPEASYAVLDDNLRYGIRLADLLRHAQINVFLDRFSRVNRQGKVYPRRNLDASNPELRKMASEVATRAAAAYGDHPGLTMLMVSTEIRDGSQIAFNGTEAAEYRKFSGKDIPDNALGRSAPPVEEIAGFPALGNLDPEMPLYGFFRWWWVDGDGWNPLHRLVQESYRKGLGKRADQVLTFFDPSVRVPPIFGSGAGLDMLNQWTYSYPSPIKIATAVDEQRAMARGNGGQKLMKTVQAIWYRDPPAPKNKQVANPPAWVKEYPDAAYITIAPDHLQESVWSEISRRLDMLSFHGYGSLVDRDDRSWNSYRFTNPESKVMFKKLVDTLIRPLGPVLKLVPERPMRTAVLYTLGSNLFGSTGSWGWTWGADAEMHQLLQRAQLDPGVIFDEDIFAGRLASVKLLALPNCAIMDQRVIEAIWKFQDAGGLVIGDGDLNPLILPDFTVEYGGVEEAKALYQKLGAVVPSYFAAISPEVATHVRSWKKSDYLFAINDHRGFGDYVGMYGYAAEVGLPLQCKAKLARTDVKAIYDLMQHKEIPFAKQGNQCTWDINFTTNDGRLYLAMPQKIAKVTVDAPTETTLDKTLELTIQVLDARNKPVDAILPIEIRIHAPDDSEIVGSGYYAVTDGYKKLTILPSCNDAPGEWKIEVSDLAAGLTTSKTVTVK